MEGTSNKIFKGNSVTNIKSKYIFKKIFEHLQEKILLKIIKINKHIKENLNKDIYDYKTYKTVIIDIIPSVKGDKNIFINYKKEDGKYYHIYFNDNEKEEKKNFFYKPFSNNWNEEVKISKITIIIDSQINSFKK